MSFTRRGFFGTLLAAVVAKLMPAKKTEVYTDLVKLDILPFKFVPAENPVGIVPESHYWSSVMFTYDDDGYVTKYIDGVKVSREKRGPLSDDERLAISRQLGKQTGINF